MNYPFSVLTQELQRAVKNRDQSGSITPTSQPAPRKLQYSVSTEARDHLAQLRAYREKAKDVRVGTY